MGPWAGKEGAAPGRASKRVSVQLWAQNKATGFSESGGSRWEPRSWGGGVDLDAPLQPERRGLEASRASEASSFGV